MIFVFVLLIIAIQTNVASADCSHTYSIGEWKISTEEHFKPEDKISDDGNEYYAVKELKDTSYSVFVSGIGTRLTFSINCNGLSALFFASEDVGAYDPLTYKIDSGETKNARIYSANDKTLGFEEPLSFLLSLLGGNTLTVNYRSVWDEPRSTILSISGIENALEHILPFHQKTNRAVQRYMIKHKIKRQYECQSNYRNNKQPFLDYYLQ